ncbi:uncharacterized protein MEPE_02403 [Melanopsichium pennsylvanicum]|uniref:Uncharacterized protein n=2 Tax=Melanopsichium pennsylvanicum TaxID=63383 RepID=A0AAJ4XKZ6_9BASI|nr:putative protein [Melanopsichium pennsylvanicum 4]SNX83696.1 uncharacterized protein MEPE_02403 [Melanopsichium pennsylvanicum]
MLVSTYRSVLAQSRISSSTIPLRPVGARTAIACLSRTLLTARGFTTTLSSFNAFTTDVDSRLAEFPHLRRLEHVFTETPGPSQASIIPKIDDARLVNLSLVIKANKQWQPAPAGFPLPQRDRADNGEEAYKFAEYVYNTFSFESMPHLKLFHRTVAEKLESRHRTIDPVLLLDSRSRTLTIGLPSSIGIQPPFPAKDNTQMVLDLLNKYRSESSSEHDKAAAIKEIKKYVVPNGFKSSINMFSLYVFTLYESVRAARISDIQKRLVKFGPSGDIKRDEEGVSEDRRSMKSQNRRGEVSKNQSRSKENADGGKVESKAADRLRSFRNGVKLSADDPKLPEAGTFVAQDGDKHRPSEGVDNLQDYVPFPIPTAQEMGINKPTETGADIWFASNPKSPEATTFVAEDGDHHKHSEGVQNLQEHVPSAEEVGINKPTQTGGAETPSADNPRLPEAGTFVAPDGDKHKLSQGVDDLAEHVPFPNPTAEEMGIRKPTET